MPTPIESVTAFLAEWSKSRAAMLDSYRNWFRPDTVWENVGLATTTGVDAALALLDGFIANFGLETMKVDLLAISAVGNKVLTERIDRVINAAGEEVGQVRLMGIFEMEDGKIVAWRDYFDPAPFKG